LSKPRDNILAAVVQAARQRHHHARRRDAIKAEACDWHGASNSAQWCGDAGADRHWSARGLFDRNKSLWASFVVETHRGQDLPSSVMSCYGAGQAFPPLLPKRTARLRLAILPDRRL